MTTEATEATDATDATDATPVRRPAALAWSTSNCSVGRTLDVVG